MKNALIVKLALALLLTLSPAASLAQTKFPQLPDTAEVVGGQPAMCDDFLILVLFYDDATGRTEFYLEDGTLFGVTTFKADKATGIYILQPDKSVKFYRSIEELKGAKPCDMAAKLRSK
jgi:hypothetical protein